MLEVRIEMMTEIKDLGNHLQRSDCSSLKTREILEVDSEKSDHWNIKVHISGDHTG